MPAKGSCTIQVTFTPQATSKRSASLQISDNYALLAGGSYWWTVLFPGLAVASLVVGVNLIADGLQQVVER